MNNRSFDSLTRQTTVGGNLPGALSLFRGPGVEALTRQIEAEGKKRGRKKTRRKQNGQACPPAVDRCGPQRDAGGCACPACDAPGPDPDRA